MTMDSFISDLMREQHHRYHRYLWIVRLLILMLCSASAAVCSYDSGRLILGTEYQVHVAPPTAVPGIYTHLQLGVCVCT